MSLRVSMTRSVAPGADKMARAGHPATRAAPRTAVSPHWQWQQPPSIRCQTLQKVDTADLRCAKSQRRQHSYPFSQLNSYICECELTSKCRHDRRLKQQTGWKVDQLPDGTFRWTTPA